MSYYHWSGAKECGSPIGPEDQPTGTRVVDPRTGVLVENVGTAAQPIWVAVPDAPSGPTIIFAEDWTDPTLARWLYSPGPPVWVAADGTLTATGTGTTAYLTSGDFVVPTAGVVTVRVTVTVPDLAGVSSIAGLLGIEAPGDGDGLVNLQYEATSGGRWRLTIFGRDDYRTTTAINLPTATIGGTVDLALVYDYRGPLATATLYVAGAAVGSVTETLVDPPVAIPGCLYFKSSQGTFVYGPLTVYDGAGV